MQTLEFSEREGPVRLSIHQKRGLAVLHFPDGGEVMFAVPPEGIRLAFPHVPRLEVGPEWKPPTGLAEQPKPAVVLMKVEFPSGKAWFLLTTYQGVWSYFYTKPSGQW